MSLVDIQNYIGGKLQNPLSENWLDNVNPATGQVYSRCPNSDAKDVDAAVQAATAAFPEWSQLANSERANWLNKIADGIEQRMDELARAETDDNGKPFSLARSVDIPRCVTNLRFFASIIQGFESQSHSAPDGINYTLRSPLGVVSCISPWNLPLYLFTWKIAPALAAGNCVIGKPSEVTPMTAHLFSEICHDVGLPAGVLNVLHGEGKSVGDPILTHPEIKAISFTGGTTTGAHVAAQVAPRFKKLSLELGGKNPNLIFADCDYEMMLATSLKSSFANQGQICLCGSRIFVERPLYERFKNDFVQGAKQLVVGNPHDENSDLGAVVSESHRDKILACIKLAREEGGQVLCGGEAAEVAGKHAEGFFIQPTVIEGLSDQCRTNQEEIFGPVVTIQPFETEAEVIDRANSTPYGLSATVWTNDLKRAHRVSRDLQSGVVWVNSWLVRDLRTPFGGMKSSGVGREGGLESLRFFTEPKNVFIAY